MYKRFFWGGPHRVIYSTCNIVYIPRSYYKEVMSTRSGSDSSQAKKKLTSSDIYASGFQHIHVAIGLNGFHLLFRETCVREHSNLMRICQPYFTPPQKKGFVYRGPTCVQMCSQLPGVPSEINSSRNAWRIFPIRPLICRRSESHS